MGGKFNPFASKQQEVLRPHAVANGAKARKVLAKCERKRPCVWVEIPSLEDLDAKRRIDALSGETSVVLFLHTDLPTSVPDPLPAVLDELVVRLWKNFNKLYLVYVGAGDEDRELDAGP